MDIAKPNPIDVRKFSLPHGEREVKYGLPEDIHFCKRCVISNQRPNSAVEYQHTKQSRKSTIAFDENGLCDAQDTRRSDFIQEHINWLRTAIAEGAPVKGYLHWSLLDNFEFVDMRGFWPRFGLIEIDFKTQERKVRPSALVYKKIIEENLKKFNITIC